MAFHLGLHWNMILGMLQNAVGAVGKGYTGDILSELLKEQGVTSALLDIGGNIQMIGRKPDGRRWRLGIQNPFGEGSIGVLESEDGAVVSCHFGKLGAVF